MIKPLSEYIFVKEEKKEKGVIEVPDPQDQSKIYQGRVVAVGEYIPDESGMIYDLISAGDRVLFNRFSKEEVEVEIEGVKEKLMVVKKENVFGIIE